MRLGKCRMPWPQSKPWCNGGVFLAAVNVLSVSKSLRCKAITSGIPAYVLLVLASSVSIVTSNYYTPHIGASYRHCVCVSGSMQMAVSSYVLLS